MIAHITVSIFLGLYTAHIDLSTDDVKFWMIMLLGNVCFLLANDFWKKANE